MKDLDNQIQTRCGPNDTFVARLRASEGRHYLSILQVPAHPSLNGSRVQCYVRAVEEETTVGEGRLEVIGECCT